MSGDDENDLDDDEESNENEDEDLIDDEDNEYDEDDCSSDVSSVSGDDDEDEDEEIKDDKGNHIRDEDLLNDTISIIEKVRKFVRLIRKNRVICDHTMKLIESGGFDKIDNLILDFHVRWNSTFKMLKRFIDLFDVAKELTTNPSKIDGITLDQAKCLRSLDFNDTEFEFLRILTETLKPFFEATKIISGQKNIQHCHYHMLLN